MLNGAGVTCYGYAIVTPSMWSNNNTLAGVLIYCLAYYWLVIIVESQEKAKKKPVNSILFLVYILNC